VLFRKQYLDDVLTLWSKAKPIGITKVFIAVTSALRVACDSKIMENEISSI